MDKLHILRGLKETHTHSLLEEGLMQTTGEFLDWAS